MTEVKLCSRGDWGGEEAGGRGWRGSTALSKRPRGSMVDWRCVCVRLVCSTGLVLRHASLCFKAGPTSEKELLKVIIRGVCRSFVCASHWTPPWIHTTSSVPALPPAPHLLHLSSSSAANLASVRAWRTLSAVSTAELVVAWSAEELSPPVSVAAVTQSPASSLIRARGGRSLCVSM